MNVMEGKAHTFGDNLNTDYVDLGQVQVQDAGHERTCKARHGRYKAGFL